MTDEFNHRLTMVVPAQFLDIANHLALFVGQSSADIETFTTTDWVDSAGNLYAVCSTAVKPVVLGLFDADLSLLTIPEHAGAVDVAIAQQALDITVKYLEGLQLDNSKLMACIDTDPHEFFDAIGLSRVPQQEAILP